MLSSQHHCRHTSPIAPMGAVLAGPHDGRAWIPSWTYGVSIEANAPFLSVGKADPVNVIIKGYTHLSLTRALLSHGWERCPTWKITRANINFIVAGHMAIPQRCNYFLPKCDGSRYHLRIWELKGAIIGQAHIDSPLPHTAHLYEAAEKKIASHVSHSLVHYVPLGNKSSRSRARFNDGYAICIRR